MVSYVISYILTLQKLSLEIPREERDSFNTWNVGNAFDQECKFTLGALY